MEQKKKFMVAFALVKYFQDKGWITLPPTMTGEMAVEIIKNKYKSYGGLILCPEKNTTIFSTARRLGVPEEDYLDFNQEMINKFGLL